jgi:hypothetical protein
MFDGSSVSESIARLQPRSCTSLRRAQISAALTAAGRLWSAMMRPGRAGVLTFFLGFVVDDPDCMVPFDLQIVLR